MLRHTSAGQALRAACATTEADLSDERRCGFDAAGSTVGIGYILVAGPKLLVASTGACPNLATGGPHISVEALLPSLSTAL